MTRGMSEIKRRDRKRRIRVLCTVDKSITTPTSLQNKLSKKDIPLLKKKYPDSKLIKNGDILSVNIISKRQKTKPFLPTVPTSKTDFSHQLAFSYIKPLMKGKGKNIITTEIQVEQNNLTFEI
ncbi:Outer membrane efflux protein [Candidatus Magnetomorum sp. HK-1]|nr:Outer membrane efflux protein [Candidatus Magnetomorum sp. HK-1]